MIPFAEEVRHIDGLIGSFGISEQDYISTDALPGDQLAQRAIYCNLKVFVQQQQYFFDTLWNKAIPSEQKIKEIEKGIVSAKIETITDPSKIETKYIQILEKATNEILIIFPTLNSMRRQFHIVIFNVLKKNIGYHNDLKIRILFPSFISTSPPSPSPSPSSLLLSNETIKENIYREHEDELDNIVYIKIMFPSVI